MFRIKLVSFFAAAHLLGSLTLEANPGQEYERLLYPAPAIPALTIERMPQFKRDSYIAAILSSVKNDYVGNHAEIDRVGSSLGLWLSNWEHPTRSPTVVGVWGLTGSGKTSVVRDIVSRAGLDSRTIYIDLKQASDSDHAGQFMKQLVTMFSPRMTQEREKWSNEPRKMVVILDEFQTAQTRARDGSRISNRLVEFLMQCLGNQGKVVVENSDYRSLFDSIQSDLEALKSIESGGRPYISDYPRGMSQTGSKAKAFVRQRIRKNQELLATTSPNIILDFSQALFITLGNFPVGFRNADSVNPEVVRAEELRQSTADMTRTDLTEVLKKIFHPEDLGRLGPDQFIFHSILEEDYYELIEATLAKISSRAKELGVQIEVDEKLRKILVTKVLMPSLGPRVFLEILYKTFDGPLLNVKRHIASFSPGKKAPRITKFMVSVSDDGTTIQWIPQNTSISTTFEQPSLWGDLSAGVWRSDKNESSASQSSYAVAIERFRERRLVLTAVHEAAHATVMAATQKIVPEMVQTDSQSANIGGFTRFPTELELEATFRSDVMDLLALALAGVAGEQMVFGEPSMGGVNDFEKANHLAASLFRSGNLETGEKRTMATDAAFRLFGPAPLGFEMYRENVDSALQEALGRAKAILQSEKRFFLELSQVLSKQPSVRTEELLALVREHWADASVRKQILSFRGSGRDCAENLRKQLKKIRRESPKTQLGS